MNKTFSKVLTLMLSIMLICGTIVVPASAAATLPGQYVKLASPAAAVEVGDVVEIPVTINNPNTLNGVMVKVTWDPTMLKADPTYKMGKWACYTKPANNADDVNMFGGMFDLNGNEAANGVIVFGGAAGYEFEDYEVEISLGTLKFTVLDAAAGKNVVVTVDPVGTYATSIKGNEVLDTPVNATIKVNGGAVEPVMSGITVAANAVEIADADKEDTAKIAEAIKAAITSIKAQWTEGKEDTDVAVADATITVDTAAKEATVAYNGFTAKVAYTVAAPVVPDEPGNSNATLPGQFVKLASPAAAVEVGAVVEVPVTINNPNTLNGVMVKVTWDPTMLKADPTYKMGKWACYTKPANNADDVNMFGGMFDLNGNEAANGVIVFGGAAGYEFEDYTTEISLGTLKFTVLDAAAGKDVVVTVDPVGTYATSIKGNEVLDTPVNATIKVNGGVVEVNKYTVTYKVNGEVVKTFEDVEEGTATPAYEYTAPEGYTFSGWGEVPATVTENLVIEGTTAIKTFTVTYKVNGEVVDTFTAEYGAEVPVSNYTAPEGYTFSGWGEVPATVTEDLVIEGTTTLIPVPEIKGITVAANAVEIADADKADTAKIEAAIKAAITSIKAQWTEGKEDTEVAIDDVTITVDTAAKEATIAYGEFTAKVTYTVADPIIPDEPGDSNATLPGQFVKLASPAAAVEVGDVVEIPVSINNPNTLNGVMVKVTWDPTMLKADPTYKMGKWACYTKPANNADDVNMFGGMFDLNGNDAANGVIVFGGAAGYEFEDYTTEISLGTLKFTVLEGAAGKDVVITVDPVGTYATSIKGNEVLDTPVNAIVKVNGGVVAEPVMSGITVAANAVEIAYADKDDTATIEAAIKAAITSVKAQWTEGKEDTDVAVDDVTITVDTANTKATITYGDFTAEVTYTVAAKPIVKYTVTFKAEGAEDIVIEVEEGQTIGDAMPADPTNGTLGFDGWFDGETAITADTVVNGNIVATAAFSRIVGDVNCDGVKDSKDAIYLLNHCALPDLYPVDDYGYTLDMNGDGAVSSLDAIYLLNSIAIPTLYSLAK